MYTIIYIIFFLIYYKELYIYHVNKLKIILITYMFLKIFLNVFNNCLR